ncbi:hypothetical protein Pta02_61070 [Planobispora takensis]|uniref:Uncharacterized protein n=2 Tax=Planobispora takensis TaxID=1367882 RepID=A0A8J3TAZ0_9ACTN|nr:hypothetical protein Pta02_61070 [Planobispora takensis]
MLWAAALLTALAPSLYSWVSSLLSGDDGSRYYTYMAWGQCAGARIHFMIPEHLISRLPLFDYGGAPLLLLALAGWYAGIRTGRERLGGVIARCAAALLLLRRLPDLLLLALDGAFGPHCLEAWGPPEVVNAQAGWDLYHLLPPILVLLAVRLPRRAFVRRGRLARTTAMILTVTATLLLTAQAAPSGKVSTEGELDCAGFGDGTAEGLSQAEKTFLCEVRGYHGFHGDDGIEGWQDAPDRVVVAQGHHLCGVATRYGGDTGAPAVQEAPHGPLASALGPLCPAVARWREQEGARRQAEEAAYHAARDKACGRHRPHRPKIKPVRQARATMWTEFWTITGWEEGYEGAVPDLVEELVGSERGGLAIWAADEIGHACVTVEAYRRQPPLEVKGWDEVVQVGYDSPSGALTLSDGNGESLTGLTAAGPGAYRVRVHLRGRKLVYQVPDPPDGAVELLIMVFPGEQDKPVVYR